MRLFTTSFFILLITKNFYGFCSNVEGALTRCTNQKIKLFIYDGLECVEVSNSLTDKRGHFHLSYPDGYQGMGYLEIPDEGRLELVLNNSDVHIAGDNILATDKIKFRNSRENRLYYHFLADHKRRDDYLLDLHQRYSQSSKIGNYKRKDKSTTLSDKIRKSVRIELEFIDGLEKGTYISWYIPLIRFIHDMSVQSEYNPSFIPFFIEDFKKFDLVDKRLIHSGLYSDLLKGNLDLIDDKSKPRDEVYIELSKSINDILSILEGKDNRLLVQVNTFLSNQLKEKGFGGLSKHINLSSASHNNDLLKGHKSRSMKVFSRMDN